MQEHVQSQVLPFHTLVTAILAIEYVYLKCLWSPQQLSKATCTSVCAHVCGSACIFPLVYAHISAYASVDEIVGIHPFIITFRSDRRTIIWNPGYTAVNSTQTRNDMGIPSDFNDTSIFTLWRKKITFLLQVSDHIADLFEACKVGDYGPIRELQALEREAVNGGVVRSVRVQNAIQNVKCRIWNVDYVRHDINNTGIWFHHNLHLGVF